MPRLGLPRRTVVTTSAAAVVLMLAVAVVAVLAPGGGPSVRLRAQALPTPAPTDSTSPTPVASPEPPGQNEDSGPGAPPIVVGPVPERGSGAFAYAGGQGPIFGGAGGLLTYRVAVETSVPVSVDEFTGTVDRALGDPRGWTGRGERRFQRVPGAQGSSFTLLLASPWTAHDLCRPYVDIRISGVPYSSCQAGSQIVVNSDRYLTGANAFTGTLDVYRTYVVNHEVGHRLGKGHVHCPGPGQLAPVMLQQTLRMEGCLPNGWPYPELPAPSPSASPTPSPSPSPSAEPGQTPPDVG